MPILQCPKGHERPNSVRSRARETSVTARDYLSLIHKLPCVVHFFKTNEKRPCDEAHHVIGGDPWSCVPLCRDCHQGAKGLHGLHRRPFYALWKIDELWLVARTVELVMKL